MAGLVIGDRRLVICIVDEISKNDHNVAFLVQESRWIDLANRLKVGPATIEKLRRNLVAHNVTSFHSTMEEVLLEWYGKEGDKATAGALTEALVQIGAIAVADDLRKFTKSREISAYGEVVDEVAIFLKVPERVDDFLKEKYLNLLIICTSDCYLTIRKITDSLQGIKTFDNLSAFQTSLILKGNEISIVVDVDVADFLRKTEKVCGGRKVILITRDSVKIVEEYVGDCDKADILSDTFKWSDLNDKTQELVWEKVKALFETEVSFEDVNGFEEELLADLISERDPVIFKDTVPDKISYYIERQFISGNVISKRIFEHKGNDKFLITGMERSELSRMVKSRTETVRNQINRKIITVKWLVLEVESDFEDICNITEDPVHWLNYDKDGMLTWVKSRGDMKIIHRYIDNEQVIIGEDEFIHMVESSNPFGRTTVPVLISDSPGMGKSVILGNIGMKLNKQFPGRIVCFIVVREFFGTLKNLMEELTVNQLLDALSHQVSKYALGRKAFIEKIKGRNSQLELLIDGFDEQDENEQKRAAAFLKLISSKCPNIRVWVTTRPHLLEQLEITLETLGYNIQAFEFQDQVDFLVRYWSQSTDKELDEDRLENFADNCLRHLESLMKDKNTSIAGIPLQCRLIGDVFQEDAVKNTVAANNLYSTTFSPEIAVTSITDLYSHTIKKKVQEYIRKYGEGKVSENQIIKEHVYLSLVLLFPRCSEKFRGFLGIGGVITDEDIYKVGIMERCFGNTPKFIHRTFAEYFVAVFVVEQFENDSWNEDLREWLLAQCLVTRGRELSHEFRSIDTHSFEHEVICFFVDSTLSSRDYQNETLNLNMQSRFTLRIADQICHACVFGDFNNIFNFFDEMGMFIECANEIFDDELVIVSTCQSGIELLSKICDAFEEHKKKKVMEIRTRFDYSLLFYAVRRGDYSIVEYMIFSQGFEKLVKDGSVEEVLHRVGQEKRCSKVDQNVQIVKLLVGMNKRLLEQRDENEYTPLLNDTSLEVMEELIRLGANVEAVDKDGYNVLHKLDYVGGVTNEDYYRIMRMIPMDKLKKLVHMKTQYYGRTPLHSIVIRWDVDDRTLELFKEAEADFNAVNDDEETVIMAAIRWGRSVEFIKTLMSFEATLDNGDNGAVIRSAIYNEPVLEWLVNEQGFDINLKDSEGNTGLHKALKDTELDTVMTLVEHGAHATVRNNQGQTPVGYAFEKCINANVDISLLEYLDEQGWLNTTEEVTLALKKCVSRDRAEVGLMEEFCDRMVEKGADLKVLDKDKNTLVHDAAKGNCAIGVKYLVGRRGLNVNARNKYLQTPLHYALYFIRFTLSLETVRALVELGADLNARDNENWNVLHRAIKYKAKLEVLEYLLSNNEAYHGYFTSGDVLYLAARHSEYKHFKWICEEYLRRTGVKWVVDVGGNGEYKSVLHAVLHRNIGISQPPANSIIRYLVEEQGYGERLGEEYFQDVIHVLVRNTSGGRYAAEVKIKAVKYLVGKYHTLVTGRDAKGRMPWEVEKVHPELKLLLKILGGGCGDSDLKQGNRFKANKYWAFVILLLAATAIFLYLSVNSDYNEDKKEL